MVATCFAAFDLVIRSHRDALRYVARGILTDARQRLTTVRYVQVRFRHARIDYGRDYPGASCARRSGVIFRVNCFLPNLQNFARMIVLMVLRYCAM